MARAPEHLYPSPLRYPGGKGKLANYIKLILLENDLVGAEYVEPYAGGASVALSLLFEEYASHIHINDLNRSIYTFWKVLLERTDELNRRISDTPVNTDEWHRQRAIQDVEDPDELDLAFSTFFLNRTSRSGIIGGGIIGGLDQSGNWKIDARYRRNDLIPRIERIARFRNRITVTGKDAAQYLVEDMPKLDDAFVYLDPPYYVKGEGLYQNFYDHTDHQAISALVRDLAAPWVVSYDAAAPILRMYELCQSVRYDLSYSAGDRYKGSEVMFFSEELRTPKAVGPAGVKDKLVDERRLAS